MSFNVLAYAAANKYTEETVEGGGAVKGKNCTIESIETVGENQKVNFKWVLDDGTVKTGYMIVPPGPQGEKGDDGEPGETGEQGDDGYSPQVTVNTDTEDEYTLNVSYLDSSTGEVRVYTTPNLKGSGSGADHPLTPEQLATLINLLN